MFLYLNIACALPAEALVVPRYASTDSVAFTIGMLALGVLLGLLAYTLFLAISTRERMFYYFSAIMVLLTLLQTFAAYDRFFFSLTYNRVTLITHLLFITFLLFFEDFFSLKTHDPKLSRINRISLVVIAVFTGFFLAVKTLFPQAYAFTSVLDFIRELFVFYTNILFLTTIIRAIAWMRTEALLILIAFIPPAILTSINALSMFSFMDRYDDLVTFLMTYNQPIGLSLQAILFSLAMGNRYNRIKLERQKAETERKRLEKLDAEKTEFFMNMSHELRTPLTIILGTLGQLREGTYGDSLRSADRMLSLMERNVLRLLKQISHLLRLEKPSLTTPMHSLPVAATVRSLVEEYTSVAIEREITLSCECTVETEPLRITMQGDDFETALLNLISNALKFTPSHQSVTVRAMLNVKQELIISVSDTGTGIAQEQQQHLFDRYYTSDNQSRYGQTGIGLSLVQTIMAGCDGSVTVESTFDVGSTFTLTFPSSLLTTSQEDALQKERIVELSRQYTRELADDTVFLSQQMPTEGPDILIIDDNRDMCTYLASLLASTYRVYCAHSGAEALKLMTRISVSLIICDIMMPEMDGHEVLANIRSQSDTASLPVIFLTARDSAEEEATSLQEGAVYYLTKPFHPQVLLATVETVLHHDREVATAQITQLRNKIDAAFDDLEQQTIALHPSAVHRFAQSYHLSQREEDILILITKGNSDKEIASTLGLSNRTIANHNQRIYQKTGVHSRFELISSIYRL